MQQSNKRWCCSGGGYNRRDESSEERVGSTFLRRFLLLAIVAAADLFLASTLVASCPHSFLMSLLDDCRPRGASHARPKPRGRPFLIVDCACLVAKALLEIASDD